jgi:hypothetical protein
VEKGEIPPIADGKATGTIQPTAPTAGAVNAQQNSESYPPKYQELGGEQANIMILITIRMVQDMSANLAME